MIIKTIKLPDRRWCKFEFVSKLRTKQNERRNLDEHKQDHKGGATNKTAFCEQRESGVGSEYQW